MPVKSLLFDLQIASKAITKLVRRPRYSGTVDVYLCVVDHYEPSVGGAARPLAEERVEDWLRRYPQVACKHRDADGVVPPHCFFYPWDEYNDWEMKRISELCSRGFGEVEIHLHHKDDTDAGLRAKLRDAISAYRAHGNLSQWPDGRPAFAFIHGNWSLDNSRQEGGINYCGVDNEITVLQEEGCFADLTFPAWRQLAQPRTLNSVYYALDDPLKPKSYDTGAAAAVGRTAQQGLLMVQGPLVPCIERSEGRSRPGVDDADLAASAARRYAPCRFDRWVRAHVHVDGRPDRIFIKLCSHGAQDSNRESMLSGDLDALYTDAEARYNDGKRYRLHYVTARELVNVIHATEAGVEDSAVLRDWKFPRPANAQ